MEGKNNQAVKTIFRNKILGDPGLLLTTMLFMALSYMAAGLPLTTLHNLTTEDGLYENIGAVFFLLTGLVFLYGFLRTTGKEIFLFRSFRRNYAFLLLGILFIFVSGEEISWGQRIFQVTPGEFFSDQNLQRETNLHNLRLFSSVNENNVKRPWWDVLSMSRLFRLFWFTWCLLLPLLSWLSSGLGHYIRRTGIPGVPAGFGLVLGLNYVIMKILEVNLDPSAEVVEIEECVTAFLMFCLSVQLGFLNPRSYRQALLLHAAVPIHTADR